MAILILQDGTRWEGAAFGAESSAQGEVVFVTDMLGHQLLLTDPAYHGQILCLTYPLIGNVGINAEDMASGCVQIAGLIVQTLCDLPSNWRCKQTLPDYLSQQGIPAMQGVDTRALAKHLRKHGVQRGRISAGSHTPGELETLCTPVASQDLVAQVTCKERYTRPGGPASIAVLDLGVDAEALQALTTRGYGATVYPAETRAEEILSDGCDGVLLSGGPGSPLEQTHLLNTVRTLMRQRPVLGIGLGYELMILAEEGGVVRLAYGHHGNQPVKASGTGWCDQSAQRHLYAADPDKLPSGAQITYQNANDGTIAGLRFKGGSQGVQFHPSAAIGGARSTARVWDEFLQRVTK